MNIVKVVAQTLFALFLVNSAYAAAPIYGYKPYALENSEFEIYKNNSYAYAPATVYHEGQYHQFYCSTGSMSNVYFEHPNLLQWQGSWDHVRYRSSKNGYTWSPARVTITQSPVAATGENCACDPAIIQGKDGYWYLFYAGNIDNYNTLVYVARSKNIQGPYEKFSGTASNPKWDRWANAPTPVLKKWTGNEKTVFQSYGIGQVSVVVGKDGKYHFWFTEGNNLKYNENGVLYTLPKHVAVNNILDLLKVNLDNPSGSTIKIDNLTHSDAFLSDKTKWPMVDFGEVRWNESKGRYEMWVPDHYIDYGVIKIKKYYSSNGVNWTLDKSFVEGPYNYAHNIGVSGDKNGWIHNDQYLLSFSGPESLDMSFSDMNNAGHVYNGGISVGSGIWGMWQRFVNIDWTNNSYSLKSKFGVTKSEAPNLDFFVGDFDNDGVQELGAVEPSTGKWYLQASTTSDKKSSVWGWQWFKLGSNDRVVAADFDGDGVTDFGALVYSNKKYKWRIFSTRFATFGLPDMPDGWVWEGMTSEHKVILGDFDGDGAADRVLYHPKSKTWYMISSLSYQFMKMRDITKSDRYSNYDLFGFSDASVTGVKGYPVPAVGDYDGDGLADMAVVDTSKGNWFIRSSQTGQAMYIGYAAKENNQAVPVVTTFWPFSMHHSVNANGYLVNQNKSIGKMVLLPGDFDGDGVTDMVYADTANGTISFLGSAHKAVYTPNTIKTYSLARLKSIKNRKILVGDFNGDAKDEICIIDPANYYTYYYKLSDTKATMFSGVSTKRIKLPFSTTVYKKEMKRTVEPVVASAPASNMVVTSNGLNVDVSGIAENQEVSIFDVRGKKVAHQVSAGQNMLFTLPSMGKYVVRSGNMSKIISAK